MPNPAEVQRPAIDPALKAVIDQIPRYDPTGIAGEVAALRRQVAEMHAALLAFTEPPSPIATGPSVIAEYKRMTGATP